MKPGNMIVLPKQDKRYKVGNISKDNKGKYRGHPDTVAVRFIEVGLERNAPTAMNMNPPIVVSDELGKFLKGQLHITIVDRRDDAKD
ncbi:hypothetical protein I8H89_00355 [Candidatus Saccharibacteria bacterium]|nr:hypothetical protein [Candidatus Saccharibacteria bacterium]